MKKILLVLGLVAHLGVSAQFIQTHKNGLDHDLYNVESIGQDIVMGGTVYPAGSLTNSDIHLQRMDQNGNVLWEVTHDIGTDERCLDIGVQGNDYVLVTGSTKFGTNQTIFLMRLDPSNGAFVDMVHLVPGTDSKFPHQFGLDVEYDDQIEQYYIAGWGTYDNVPNIGPDDIPVYKTGPLLIALDNNMNHQWTREVNFRAGLVNSFSTVEVIPGKGVAVLGRHRGVRPWVCMFDDNGNKNWDLYPSNIGGWGYIFPSKGLVFDADNDRLLCNANVDANIGGAYLMEITNVTSGTATINRVKHYSNLIFEYNDFESHHLILYDDKIYISGYHKHLTNPSVPLARSLQPALLTVDANTFDVQRFMIYEAYNPSHFVREYTYYKDKSYTNRHRGFMTNSALWGSNLALLGYDYSAHNGTNAYNLMVLGIDHSGTSNAPCEKEEPVEDKFLSYNEKTFNRIEDVSHDVDPASASQPSQPHSITYGCYVQSPCSLNITGLNRTNFNCYEYEFTVSTNTGSGTFAYEYDWDFGDGTTLTTTGPVATHDYGNSPLCMYTVCVTVSALGSDGSLCQDTWCQLMPSFVSPGCGSCISLRKAVSPIDEASEVEKGFRLFPNPAEGQTVLEFDAERTNGRLMVYSLQGQLVQDQSGLQGNRFAIDLGELSSGTYLLHFSSDQGDVRQRLVVR